VIVVQFTYQFVKNTLISGIPKRVVENVRTS